jgi:hypothetical protein
MGCQVVVSTTPKSPLSCSLLESNPLGFYLGGSLTKKSEGSYRIYSVCPVCSSRQN